MEYSTLIELAAAYVAEVKPELNSPSAAADFLRPLLKDLMQEEMWVLMLDARNKLIKAEMITRGTLTSSQVHPREIFKAAIICSAARIIIAHNHPSGDSTPSRQDLNATKTIQQAGEIIGIPLVDHTIIAGDEYVSIRQANPELF